MLLKNPPKDDPSAFVTDAGQKLAGHEEEREM